MKTSILISILCVATFATNVNANNLVSPIQKPIATSTTGFDGFHAHRKQDGVALSWSNATPGIINYVIQHSYDGYSFTTIGQVAPEFSGWNKFDHEDALPGFNHYRVGAMLSDGTIEYSDIEVVRIVKRK